MPQWPHAPVHLLTQSGAYMVTGATHDRFPYLFTTRRLTDFQNHLFALAEQYGWQLQAWAILSNHYHFTAISPNNPRNLSQFIKHLHSVSAKAIDADDNVRSRQVWYQYWDSLITYQRSYYARLRYVNHNPV
jgi:putative transposase